MPDSPDDTQQGAPAVPHTHTVVQGVQGALTMDRLVIAALAALLSGGAVGGITVGTSNDSATERRIDAIEDDIAALDKQLDLIIRLLEKRE